MDFNALFKSIVDQDNTPIVICDLDHIIIYLNPAAVKNYRDRGDGDILGKSLLDCHAPSSNDSIKKVIAWFAEDPANNRVHISFNSKANKDLYMVALRDETGKLLGYYEKHEFRNKDTSPFYDMGGDSKKEEIAFEADLEVLKTNLEKRGFKVQTFAESKDAVSYLRKNIMGKTIGFGGSGTLKALELYEVLSENNEVFWHWQPRDGRTMVDERLDADKADIYFSSVNGISMSGDIINIDGLGNRVASTLYGHDKVYFVIGKNKIAPDYESALHRARNIAAPKNAMRFDDVKTPCKMVGSCMDCQSPDRICCELSVLWRHPMGGDYEIILVDEELGL